MSKHMPMRLIINTSYEDVFDAEVFFILLTTPEGEVGLRARHENIVYVVKAGEIEVETKTDTLQFTTDGGILHMSENQAVLLTAFAALSSEYEAKKEERQRRRVQRDSEELKNEADLQRVRMTLQQTLTQS